VAVREGAAERDALHEELGRHREWLASIQDSPSWRVTAPLRALKHLGRRPAIADVAPAEREPDRGAVVSPAPGTALPRAPVHLLGWCLLDGTSLARVTVGVNGGPPRAARIAVECQDAVAVTAHPDAPLCGFEFKADLGELAEGAAVVELSVVAEGCDGRRLALDPLTFPLAPAPPRPDVASPQWPPPTVVTGTGELRLLAFTHSLGHSGGALYLVELLERLREQHPAVDIEVVSLVDGPLRSRLEAAGMPVHVTDDFATRTAARYEGHIAELSAWARPRGFDAVLVNTLGAFAGADLALTLGIPAAWVIHESFPLPMFWATAYPPPLLDPEVRVRIEDAIRSTAALVFVADATRALFVEHADPRRLHEIPYGLETDQIDAARDRLARDAARRVLGLEERRRTVLCLGTVEPRKGQGLLVQAFAQIASRHPDVDLALVGATEDAYCAAYVDAIRGRIATAGLGDRVMLAPVTPEPWRWHAAADLLVCSSDIESLPRSVTEAMAFGTPVLSSRVFGVPELIRDGENGFLCEVNDAEDLARHLDRVLGLDPAALATVAERGAQSVRERHDPARRADDVLRLLRELSASPDSPLVTASA
jgi:glycosyltransferase involved in cell wall biosynthesis